MKIDQKVLEQTEKLEKLIAEYPEASLGHYLSKDYRKAPYVRIVFEFLLALAPYLFVLWYFSPASTLPKYTFFLDIVSADPEVRELALLVTSIILVLFIWIWSWYFTSQPMRNRRINWNIELSRAKDSRRSFLEKKYLEYNIDLTAIRQYEGELEKELSSVYDWQDRIEEIRHTHGIV